MTDEEIVQQFVAGETPYSIMRWYMPDVDHNNWESSNKAMNHVYAILRTRILTLEALYAEQMAHAGHSACGVQGCRCRCNVCWCAGGHHD